MAPAQTQPDRANTPVERLPICLAAMLTDAGFATNLTGGMTGPVAPFLSTVAYNVLANILTDATKALVGFIHRKATHDPEGPSHNYDVSLLAGKAIHAIVAGAARDYRGDKQPSAVLRNLTEVPAEQFAALIESPQFSPQLSDERLAEFLGAPRGGVDERAAKGSTWFQLLVAALDRKFEKLPEWKRPGLDDPAAAGLVHAAQRLWERFPAQFNRELRQDAASHGGAWAAFQARLLRQTLELGQRHYQSHKAHRTEFAAFTRRVDGALNKLTVWVETLELNGIQPDQDTRETLTQARNLAGSCYALLGEVATGVQTLVDALIEPHLEPIRPPDPHNEQDRFKFRNRRLTAVGRASELDELHAWLDDERPFSWALWTGPAGSGKSRLALELCIQRPDWAAGFFKQREQKQPDWNVWPPRSDVAGTLIAFDYVGERGKEIGQAILTLSERARLKTNHPLPAGTKVRFLLLERGTGVPADAPTRPRRPASDAGPRAAAGPDEPAQEMARIEPMWLTTLQNEAKANSEPARSTYAIDVKDGRLERPLGGIDEAAARAIIREEAALRKLRLTRQQEDVALEFARRVDPMLRPLFVAMAAEAVREWGGTFEPISEGGFDALVDYIRDKE